MKVKFDSLNRFEPPKFYVCNPGSTYNGGVISGIIGCIPNTADEELVLEFSATSSLNFRVYQAQYDDPMENEYASRIYKSLQNRRLIFVDDIGYFVINSVSNEYSDGVRYKDIRASSCEVEIENKMLTYIEDGTYQFTDLINRIVSTIPAWSIGYIDSAVKSKYRTFEGVSENTNTLAFMQSDMQEAYECIFVFDIMHRQINVYNQSNYIRHTDIHLSKNDVVNSIGVVEDASDLYTAINVVGNENIGIAPVNPLGTNTIYNFDYYLDWMTEELRDKVVSWSDLVKDRIQPYYSLNLKYYKTLTSSSDVQFEIDRLQMQLDMYKRCRDNIVAEGDTSNVAAFNDAIEAANGTAIDISEEINETIASIDGLIADIEASLAAEMAKLEQESSKADGLLAQIDVIRNEVAIDSYFSQEEYAELCNYIYEGSYTDEYVTVTDGMTYSERFEQMAVLYDRAMARLEKASSPTQEFSVDVENFLFAKEFSHYSNQLETGCLINVELDNDDIAPLFLTTITVNYADKSLSMTFGNRYCKFDPKSLFEDVLGDVKKSANTLDYIKEIVTPVKNGELGAMQAAIQSSRDLTMRDALASSNQSIIIDGTGYTGRKKLDNGLFDSRQVKLVSNSLVFTDDAWKSCKVAIGELQLGDGSTTYGVNAHTLIGNVIVGNQLRIIDSNGDDLFEVMDGKIGATVSKTGGDSSFSWSLLPDGFRLFSKGSQVFCASKDGVDITGRITATQGTIGGCDIDASGNLKIRNINIAEHITADNIDATSLTVSNVLVKDASGSALMSAGNNQVTIGGWAIQPGSLKASGGAVGMSSDDSNWAFWAGWDGSSAQFQVKHDGSLIAKKLFAEGADIEGTIRATRGNIGGCTIDESGKLWVPSANISGDLVANSIVVANQNGTLLSAGNGTVSIGGWTVASNGLYKVTSDGQIRLIQTGEISKAHTVNDYSTKNWVILCGPDASTKANFGVTKNGTLYADGADIRGKIQATNGSIGGWDISGYALRTANSYINANGTFYFHPDGASIGYRCGFLLEDDTDTSDYIFVLGSDTKFKIGNTTLTESQLQSLLALI